MSEDYWQDIDFPFPDADHHPDNPNWERPWSDADAPDQGGGNADDWVDPALQELYDEFE